MLVIDKPAGPTSHDIVAFARRTLGERRIGHTGTLDPAASGVLPLVLGRATRLARFLSARDKSYEAVVRLGRATATGDAQGAPVGADYEGPMPSAHEIDAAVATFRGAILQRPPAYSAKKIDGERSYRIARRAERGPAADGPPPAPAAVPVIVHAIEAGVVEPGVVTLRIDCSAGFYVRSLAHDLGERLGTGAHLVSLRRTRSGTFTLADAVPIDCVERDAMSRMTPLAAMLPDLEGVTLTPEGVKHAVQGRKLGPGDLVSFAGTLNGRSDVRTPGHEAAWIRLIAPDGALVGVARPAPHGLLHPSVVLM